MTMTFLATLTECLRAPFLSGQGLDTTIANKNYAKDNGFQDYASNKAGTRLIPLYGTDTSDNFLLQGAVLKGARSVLTFDLATSASLTTQAFWIADGTYYITGISCIFQTADGAANTSFIAKATGTQAPAATNVPLMSGTFNMNATSKTVQNATMPAWPAPVPGVKLTPAVQVNKGDRLVYVQASAVTSLAGVSITIELTPGNRSMTADYNMNANAGIGTTALLVSNGSYLVTGVQAVWATAGSDAGAVTGDITIDTGTQAPGAGTTVLAAAFSMKTAINTVVSPALTVTAANLRIDAGSRISFKPTGALTALAGLVVVVSLTCLQDCVEVSFTLKANASLGVDQTIFTALRNYELVASSCTFSTAAGGVLVGSLTRESGVTAAGAGTSIQSGTFNLNATANTTQVATLLTLPNNYILPGDRVSFHFSAAAQAVVGLVVNLTLRPR